ncbi:slightly ste11-like protein [Sporothrix eucalyptigena]
MGDMQTFAFTPTPIVAKDYTDGSNDKTVVDKDTQASGVRAMVMSLSYLKKLEVLQRICPPRPMLPKRGPIIAIEGYNAELREIVGQVVERILAQSGEFDVVG